MNDQDVAGIVYQAVDLLNARAVREFSVPPSTFIGPGGIARIGEAITTRGIDNVYIVIDEMLDRMGLADSMYRALSSSGVTYSKFCQKPGEPDTTTVDEIVRGLNESHCGGVVAFGGGSTLDAAKAAIVLAANPGLTVDQIAQDPSRIANRRVPFIAVPTTAGTGSEATNATVIKSTTDNIKQLIIHPDLIPDLAVIDACLTLGVPPGFTAATGVDALTHSIEAYVATFATPLTKALAYRAITLIGESLPIAVGQGKDVQARESMMLASYMAGIAFSNAGLGLCHAMAHQLGPAYEIPHGMANAILLPSVMNFNQLVCKQAFCEIGHALSGRIVEPREAIDCVQNLIIDLGLPANLRDAGGNPDDFAAFAEAAIEDPSLASNPRTVSKAQIIEVYRHAYSRS